MIAIGLALRAWLLLARGTDYEVDQAVILYWGRKAIQSKDLLIFAPEFTRWEMLTSYYYGAFDLLNVNPQWGAYLLSAVEIAMLGAFTRKILGRAQGLIAMALLSVLPWHLYYSSIVGTCVGVGLWPFALLLLSDSKKATITGVVLRALALWHYSAFRCYLAAEALWGLLHKNFKRVAAPVAGFALFLGALLLVQPESWSIAFFRGGYAFNVPGFDYVRTYARAIVFFVTPALENHVQAFKEISDMEIGRALSHFMGPWGFPLTLIGTLLFVVGFVQTLRKKTPLRFLAFYLVVSVLLAGFAPSLTHYLFLAPVAILFVVAGLTALPKKSQAVVFVATALNMAILSAQLVPQVAKPQPRDYFAHRITVYKDELQKLGDALPRFLLSSEGFFAARYWQEKTQAFNTVPPDGGPQAETQMRSLAGRGDAWILVDFFEDPELNPQDFPEIAAQNQRVRGFVDYARKYAQVVEERKVPVEGIGHGVLMKIRWP